MEFNLPKLYPITDTAISGLSHTEQVEQLLQGGATLIQLRDKLAPPRSFLNDARKALRAARAAGAKLLINDRVDIALALSADGVHLGQSDLPVGMARKLLGDRAIIGFSTHDIEQARHALTLPIDYLAFGPIYSTKTKENPDPVVGLKSLSEVKAMAGSLPVVAIGGIDESRIHAVFMAGANSIAIISALLADPSHIAEKLRNLADRTENML